MSDAINRPHGLPPDLTVRIQHGLRVRRISAIFGLVGGGGLLLDILYEGYRGLPLGSVEIAIAILGLALAADSAYALLPGFADRFDLRFRSRPGDPYAATRAGLEAAHRAMRVIYVLIPVEVFLAYTLSLTTQWRNILIGFIGGSVFLLATLYAIRWKWRALA